MQVKYLEVLAACLAALLGKETGQGPSRVKVQKGAPPGGDLPVAQVMEYQDRATGLDGFFVLGLPSQEMALTLANAMADKKGLAPSRVMDQSALDLLGGFMRGVVEQAVAAWGRLGMDYSFSPPSSLQQARIRPVEGFQNHSYLIALSLGRSGLLFSATFSQAQAQPAPPAEPQARVLLVDDSRTLRTHLAAVLRQAGYEVTEAADGMEAVRLYQSLRPDLVLMDLVMPKMGGLDAILAIQEKDPQARCVILTSSKKLDEVVTAKTIGVLNYLIKPVDASRLLQVVEAACQTQSAKARAKKARSKR